MQYGFCLTVLDLGRILLAKAAKMKNFLLIHSKQVKTCMKAKFKKSQVVHEEQNIPAQDLIT